MRELWELVKSVWLFLLIIAGLWLWVAAFVEGLGYHHWAEATFYLVIALGIDQTLEKRLGS